MAKKFGLEEELYYCLGKILSLLGNACQRKFIGKFKDADAKIPDEWTRLVELLEKELGLRERLTLLNKSKKCLGIEQKFNLKDSKKVNSANTVAELNNSMCHICNKCGHVVTTNSIGRPDVQYYECKKFVEMTSEDQKRILFNRIFYAQCVEAGMQFGEKYNCSREFVCPDNYHKTFQSGLHVLVCHSHREGKNIKS